MDEKAILLMIIVVFVALWGYFGLFYEPFIEEVNYTEERRLMLEERNRTQWEDLEYARSRMTEEYINEQLEIIYEKK